MANQIAGTIMSLSSRQVTTKDGRNDYIVEVVLDSSRFDQNTGQKYENYPSVDVNSQKFNEWQIKQGMRVRFDIEVRGMFYDKRDGSGKGHMNSIRAYKCEILAQPQQQPVQQPQMAAPQQSQYAPQQPQQMFQQPPYNGQVVDNNQPPF